MNRHPESGKPRKRRADEQTTHDAKPLPAVTIREAGDIPSSAGQDAAPTHLSEERAVYGENPEPSEKPKATEKPEAPEKPEQLNLFDGKRLKREVKAEYKLIGQVFDTYWLVQFRTASIS